MQMFDYSLTPDQTWTVWSADLSVNAFVDGFSSSVIDQIVVQLCSGMRHEIDVVQSTIAGDISVLESAFAALNTELGAFKTKSDNGVLR